MRLDPNPRGHRLHRLAQSGRNAWLSCSLLLGLTLPVAAVERVVRIEAPATAAAADQITVTVHARTDAGDGEQIGFFHAEYSVDGGRTWTGYCYEEKAGRTATRAVTFTLGAAGSKALVRARIAFRGGLAGDVDFNGAAIKWKDTWESWGSPPAKSSTILVRTP